jgi:hypothetical protein
MRQFNASTLNELTNFILMQTTLCRPCSIKIEHRQSNKVLYFTTYKLDNKTFCISICINDMSVGKTYKSNNINHSNIYDWIYDYCSTIPTEYIPELVITLDVDYNDAYIDTTYKQEYILLYTDTKKSIPTKIVDLNDIKDWLDTFLLNNYYRLFIIEISVRVPEFNYDYKKEIIVHKNYTYGFDHLNVTQIQPDMQPIEENRSTVGVIYDIDSKDLFNDIIELLSANIQHCRNLSKEEIEIYVYSN